jgi:teichuronic acid exporter
MKNLEVIKPFLKLLSGTIIGQVILFVLTPVATRLYGPMPFGHVASFIALVTIVGGVAMFRYEQAVLLCRCKCELKKLMQLCLSFAALVSLGCFFCLLTLNASEFPPLIVAICLFCLSTYQLMFIVLNYYRFYGKMSLVSMSNNALYIAVSLGVFSLFLDENDAIVFARALSYFLMFFLSTLLVYFAMCKDTHKCEKRFRIVTVLCRHKSFLKYSFPGSCLNILSNQLPILLIARLFSVENAAYYAMCYLLMSVPARLISVNLGNVFRERAAREFKFKKNCRNVFSEILKLLLFVSFPVFFVIIIFGDKIFNLYLGDEWGGIGLYTKVVSVRILLSFCVSPLTTVVYVANKQHIDFIWQIVLFVGVLISLLFGYCTSSFMNFFVSHTALYSVMYLMYLPILFRISRGENPKYGL